MGEKKEVLAIRFLVLMTWTRVRLKEKIFCIPLFHKYKCFKRVMACQHRLGYTCPWETLVVIAITGGCP